MVRTVARPLVHPLMVLGFDVYADPPEKTVAENLLFVRLIQRAPNGNINETRFKRYEKLGAGWIAPEVSFFTNGQPGIAEEYADLKVGMSFAPALFEPAIFGPPAWVR